MLSTVSQTELKVVIFWQLLVSYFSIHTVVPVGSGALVGNFKGRAVVSKLENAYCQSSE